METKTKKNKDGSVELEISLTKEELQRYVKAAETDLAGRLEIDGFRPGKVPPDIARKHLDESTLRSAALELAVQSSLAQASRESGLDIFEVGQISIKDNTDSLLRYTVTLSIFPEIRLVDLNKIKVTRKEVTVEAKEIDETLEAIRSSRATFTDSLAPVRVGNKVEVDFKVSKGGQLIAGGESKNHPVIVGKNNFIPGFEEALVGMSKNEDKTFSLVAPEDFANREIAGQKLDFEVSVRNIQNINLPEINDDFARSLGRFQNKEQLVLNIEEGIRQEKQEKEKERARLEALNSIVAASEIEVSDRLIDDQLNSMVANFDQDLHQHGMELSLYLARFSKTEDDLRKEWRTEALKQVKMAMVLRRLAKDQKINIDPKEVEEALNGTIQSTLQSPADASGLDLNQLRSAIGARLLNEKTLQYLESVCVN